jgi:hypothetical protein
LTNALLNSTIHTQNKLCMTSARQKKRIASKDKVDNKRFIYYVAAIVVALLILLYFIFSRV